MLAAAIAAGGAFLPSCQKDDSPKETPKTALNIVTNPGSAAGNYSFVTVKANGHWTLTVKADSAWARINMKEGDGNHSDIVLDWDSNGNKNSRSCTLELICAPDTVSSVFIQLGVGEKEKPSIKADPVMPWMELPATDSKDLFFKTYPMTIDGKTYRNYSYYWDTENLVARWVAYPMNSTLAKGSCGRSDAWNVDNSFSEQYQPVLYSPYTNGGNWARGHQIPSADRQILEYNKQTFYGVNMTPQNHTLNSGKWAEAEAFVRTRCRSFDTLYVVTGCVLNGGLGTVQDNMGKNVTIPRAYFKALLGYSKAKTIGITAQTGGYTAIGFYFYNEPYSGSIKNAMKTIDELEAITGFDFFVNLPPAIGEMKASTVESTVDQWWKN